MKLARAIVAIMLCMWLNPAVQVSGQDDLNIDMLLEDLTGDPSVAPAVVAEDAAAELPADEEVTAEDEFP
ncbi:MAG TPA: hypothetical protein PK722_00250, partial [Kiritimatiellia bacterium]|nr:hypothetical protein [Kiritimatiellia bacterium]